MGTICRARMIQDLRHAFDAFESNAVALHTDVAKIGIIDHIKSREQMLSDYLSVILETCEGRELLFPTFNYDFCQTGLYNVKSDPCQVGVLNEYVRQLHPNQRTLTPVFNFCVLNNRDFSLEPVDNPFSAQSTFGELVEYRSVVIFFGADFSSNTFIHHVEEIMDIGYRYIKPFPGTINLDGDRRRIVVQYRVRPLVNGAVDYDWDRLYGDLVANGILHGFPLGNGCLLGYRADHLLEYWSAKLQEDEFYLLTPTSRHRTEQLFERYGRPLRYEVMEHPYHVRTCKPVCSHRRNSHDNVQIQ